MSCFAYLAPSPPPMNDRGSNKCGPGRIDRMAMPRVPPCFPGDTSKAATAASKRLAGEHGMDKNVAAVGGRINRKSLPASNQGGSVVASMSATARHRISRQCINTEKSGSVRVSNPSSVNIPLSTAQQKVVAVAPKKSLANVSTEEGSTDLKSGVTALHVAASFVGFGCVGSLGWYFFSPNIAE